MVFSIIMVLSHNNAFSDSNSFSHDNGSYGDHGSPIGASAEYNEYSGFSRYGPEITNTNYSHRCSLDPDVL